MKEALLSHESALASQSLLREMIGAETGDQRLVTGLMEELKVSHLATQALYNTVDREDDFQVEQASPPPVKARTRWQLQPIKPNIKNKRDVFR